MQTSPNGINLIKQFEGLRLDAYLCSGNVWTIGWGTTEMFGRKVRQGDAISIEVAEQLLLGDVKKFELIVNSRINIPLSQNQFDALVSHTYNTGGSDTLFELINNKASRHLVRDWFEKRYITAGGKLLNGLVKRRAIEAKLYFENFI